ncbi:hypothetical protein ACFVS7_23900 [Streptomyces rubiginosohelvolus]|uniref:hypothetical protein n=1 Tax=Streptomyces rubiginosohelvolus TaxID=67362 RepID=UPI0036D8482E
MTHVVRKVIHRPGGLEALIYAVRAVSGKDDADRIAAEAGIRTDGERPGAWPAPVFADDVARQARRLLGEAADIDAGRLREPVDGQAVARARAAAAGHRAEWRLRHLRCADEERAGLAAAVRSGTPLPLPLPPRLVPAAERTHWRDERGALYLRPDAATDPAADTAPGRADVLLVHGEAAAAREAYREQGAATPGDPHLLAGWLLAHTALHPGHRRLLARPERFAAAVEGEGPEVWEHAAHRLATPGPPV